jgi:hypothetical protein
LRAASNALTFAAGIFETDSEGLLVRT